MASKIRPTDSGERILITWNGSVVCEDQGGQRLFQTPIAKLNHRSMPMRLQCPTETSSRYTEFILNELTNRTFEVSLPVIGWTEVSMIDRERRVHLRCGAFYLSAESSDAITLNRAAPDAWEEFFLIDSEDLKLLESLMSHQWIVGSTRAIVDGASIRFTNDSSLRVGDLDLPLRFNIPLRRHEAPYRIVVLADGWRIEELILFNPMVYYTSFKSPVVHAQLFLSIKSLVEFGEFDGQIHVLTDIDRDELLGFLALTNENRLSVQPLHPQDWVGYVSSKYSILEWEDAELYQPVVYVDPDIVFNFNIQEMLVEVACARSLSAPVEEYSSLSTSPSAGALLLQADRCDPRNARGLNAGTIGIPNVVQHGHTLALIRTIIMNYLDVHGRGNLEWVDQEVVNYVSYKIAHFETHTISKFVRYGGVNESVHVGRINGLIHFWGCPRDMRSKLMQDYINVRRVTTHTVSP